MIANVLIDTLGVVGDKIYDYKIPDNLIKDIEIGKRVLVYFGRGKNLIPALVIGINENSEYEENKIKDIVEVLDEEVIVHQYLIDLIKYMRDNYFCTYIDALRCVLPSLEQVKRKETYSLIENDKQIDEKYGLIIELIKKRNSLASFDYLKSKLNLSKSELKEEISYLVKKDIISKQVSYYIQEEKRQEVVSLSGKYENIEDYLKKIRANAIKQISVIKALEKGELYYEKLTKLTGANRSIITKLSEMELVRTYFIDKDDEFDLSLKEEHKDVILNEEQQGVLDSYFNEKNTNKFLLHGVTGSGKTEVYIKMFKDQINKGKQCLFLVPEIALTPQMMRNIYYRFNGEVAIMHSKLSMSKRIKEWDRVRSGKAKIVLGARSALFMPFKDLGLMVIDEEHENTYKSSHTPRYDTIDLANFISDKTGAKLVLGSATPSIESYYKAFRGEYRLLEMKKRANGKDFPKVHIVDMTDEMRNGNRSPISRLLKKEIELRLKKGEQSILFMNRRGFSTYVFCRKCGYIEQCPNCDVSLTYHANTNSLKCHYCGYEKSSPNICPECGSDKIKRAGTGTQKIESHVRTMFPDVKILRMDFDTTRKAGSMEKILSDFRNNKADILIGTQMVVKGHDFANVTLVGILLADTALNFPDINSPQRTFQLCTQASGRAGRASKEGSVVMQTYSPKNKTLVYSSMHDYKKFYAYDIDYRKKMNYPPFSEILGIFIANESEAKSNEDINFVYNKIKELLKEKQREDVKLYQPMEAFIHKLKNKYIMHILLRYNVDDEIKKDIRKIFSEVNKEISSTIFAEINPVALL
ncbi:replication restart helicase PriA [Anaerofustis stercorihominis]|uniref:replication restart helicase PriA n=1 Tax=Anaerofustis stercorihominis TaxID=214853 RepID=UPI0011071209|nr:primosomal protein N' [Anaerofustis stercorihominis]